MENKTTVCQWFHYDSVVDIKPMWDDRISQGHPYKCADFMSCLERAFQNRKFEYWVLKEGDDVLGVTVVTYEYHDLTLGMPQWFVNIVDKIRTILPNSLTIKLAMIGTMETAGNHWWFDREKISPSDFGSAIAKEIKKRCSKSTLLLVRDFCGSGDDESIINVFTRYGYKRSTGLPLAVLELDGMSFDRYMSHLRSKPRAAIRKMLRIANEEQLLTEQVTISSVIDDIYPLYLSTHENAKEYVRTPIPKKLFEEIGKHLSHKTRLLVTKDKEGKIIGFMMTGLNGSVSNPYLIGFDYRWVKQYSLYYNLMYHEIAHAAELGCDTIDMGLTNYFVKQGLGASLQSLEMVSRLRGSVINVLFGGLLSRFLSEQQPEVRRRYNTD